MKLWEMDIQAITHVEMVADTLEEALNQVKENFYTLSNNENIEWNNFKIIPSSIGIVSRKGEDNDTQN